ncbi:hypothetical protein Skr01_25450 [Sphaerisporangium krabiense]|nr:hypothetical protein Skr01_25450 [Sphaerisporangium krabiense]
MLSSENHDSIDDALVRPGVIDRVYEVALPSETGRLHIYQAYFARVRHQLTPEQLDILAAITPGITDAAIRTLVNESLINALRAGHEHITWPDIMAAHQLVLSGPTEDAQHLTPTNPPPANPADPTPRVPSPQIRLTSAPTPPAPSHVPDVTDTPPATIDQSTRRPSTRSNGIGTLVGRRARYGYGDAPGRGRAIGPMGVVVAAMIGLVVFVLVGVALFGGDSVSADGGESTGPSLRTMAAMLAGLVVLGAGVVVAVTTVRAQQAARVRAEENQARAVERAQLLAAALDPETAMRLLGYPPEHPIPPNPLHTTTNHTPGFASPAYPGPFNRSADHAADLPSPAYPGP